MYKGETVNVVMPVYNEERTLPEILKRVLAQKAVDRLIIINDASKDKSLEIIKKAAAKDKRISYFTNKVNKGKGFSLRYGFSMVRNGVIIIQDADLEYFPEDYPRLLKAMDRDTVVYGTRMIDRNLGHYYMLAWFANFCLTSLFNVLYFKRLTDLNTCYKVFTKEMIKNANLKEERFLVEPELSVMFAKRGYKIKEIKIRYKGRTYAEGKKIGVGDGVAQVFYIIKSRFTK